MNRGPALALCWLALASASAWAQDVYRNPLGLEFIALPAGSFTMGTEDLDEVILELPEGKAEQVRDETPPHQVEFPSGFYLGKTEVTQSQWLAVMETRPGPDSHWQHPNWRELPVVSVTWHDAQKFIKQLNARDPQADYRLPTEAEWEYAARAGSRGMRPMPADQLGEQAWYIENSGDAVQVVASRAANLWGIHDLFGNVWEWTADWYAADQYAVAETINPQGPANGGKKVRRGGSYHCQVHLVRPGYRSADDPDQSYSVVGFRLVAELSHQGR